MLGRGEGEGGYLFPASQPSCRVRCDILPFLLSNALNSKVQESSDNPALIHERKASGITTRMAH